MVAWIVVSVGSLIESQAREDTGHARARVYRESAIKRTVVGVALQSDGHRAGEAGLHVAIVVFDRDGQAEQVAGGGSGGRLGRYDQLRGLRGCDVKCVRRRGGGRWSRPVSCSRWH